MIVDFSRITIGILQLQDAVDKQRREFYSDWDDVVHQSFVPFVRQNIDNKNQLYEFKYKLSDIGSILADLESAQSYQARIDDLGRTVAGVSVQKGGFGD